MVLKRIKDWFRKKAQCTALKIELRDLRLHYKQTEYNLQAVIKERNKLQNNLAWLQKAATKEKISHVVRILAHYETHVKNRTTHPARIELMDKTLDSLTKLIACNDLPRDIISDNIYFWREMNKTLMGMEYW